ncbi:hypothetical protein [Thermovibrio ammonificans]|uniref:Uncharacterized protein n=1 Tax=Thermovibrio ammonificans (strain DSM 15698 / JCM 12110 / HB-1) TaxID=648996 RepID=E8T2U8_THEA1|nr:hypothetical protein [Thermovibrio ammonificans]ADU97157.1 hypothetical protein Theam_1193 [Thermovibrio ammonificans HB-1]
MSGSGKISMETIVDVALRGVAVAWKKYYEITGEWLWAAPEYYLTSKIFESLGKAGVWVTLEEDMNNNIAYSNSCRPGRYPKRLTQNKRSDLSIWWKDGTLRGIVEVKVLRSSNYKPLEKDVHRICDLLNLKRDSTVQFGMIVAYTDRCSGRTKSSKERVEEVIGNVEKLIDKVAGTKLSNPSFIKDSLIKTVRDEDSSWGALACIIKR